MIVNFGRIFSLTGLDGCFFIETGLNKQKNKQTNTFFIIVHSERFRRNVFDLGIKYLPEKYCLGYATILPWTSGLQMKVEANKSLQKNQCRSLISLIVPSPLFILFRSSCKHPVSFKLHVLSKSANEWINKDQIVNSYPDHGGII